MPTLQYTIVGRRMKFSEAINTDTIVPRTMADLGNNERRMLKAMLTEPKSVWTLPKLLEACDWKDQAHVAGAGLNLQDAGILEIEEKSSKHISLGQEGIRAAEKLYWRQLEISRMLLQKWWRSPLFHLSD